MMRRRCRGGIRRGRFWLAATLRKKPLLLAGLIVGAWILPVYLTRIQQANISQVESRFRTVNAKSIPSTRGGHWEFDPTFSSPPYQYTQQMCQESAINDMDCNEDRCSESDQLMNWIYHVPIDERGSNATKPYPRFDVEGFRTKMRGKRILFLGTSLMRQQVEALIWTLGYTKVRWKTGILPYFPNCFTKRFCHTDKPSQITICMQFTGSMASQVYHEGNYTLDHSLRGLGDSSCVLKPRMLKKFGTFDLVFFQSLAWYAGLPMKLDSETSPLAWVEGMLPKLYYDSIQPILSELSRHTKTVLVLGHIGTDCQNKTAPVPTVVSYEDIPTTFGWYLAPTLWDASLQLLQDEQLDVQVIDVREPTLQSVHAHPDLDCLHFCQNSAALNIYLDIYWNEVFSKQ